MGTAGKRTHEHEHRHGAEDREGGVLSSLVRSTLGHALVLGCLAPFTACGGGGKATAPGGGTDPGSDPSSTTGGMRNAVCAAGTRGAGGLAPVHRFRVETGTGWFASPLVADLDGDGRAELVLAHEGVSVHDAAGKRLARAGTERVYAPHAIVDLDGDGKPEIIAGIRHQVFVYGYAHGMLTARPGWPASTERAGQKPEVRGLAVADLDGDGQKEVIATTTQTQPTKDGGAQVFVWGADGRLFQPAGGATPAWPRYDAERGAGHDADRNGLGHQGYGCYGENVAVGNLDDDPELEIVVTYDNHRVQVFDPDGVALDASAYYTNRESDFSGQRLTYGQFIRFYDPAVEARHYHDHAGDWPGPATDEWLQWTASPPTLADLDGDGHAEILGAPNVEKHEPYVTQAYALVVLDGAQGGGARAGERHAGWETPRRGRAPVVPGEYPPVGIPAVVVTNLQGDGAPEVLASLNDGFVYAYASDGQLLWRHGFRHGQAVRYATEPVVADLDQDGSPEVLFATYGAAEDADAGRLVGLGADGTALFDVPLPDPGQNGNGRGAAAAPTVADLDGDGQLEVLVQTFDHGVDVFTVPGSGVACLPWPTARGGPARTGARAAGP